MAVFDAMGWLDDFEQRGGRIHCDGQSYAVTLPPDSDDPCLALVDWGAVISAAIARVRRRSARWEVRA